MRKLRRVLAKHWLGLMEIAVFIGFGAWATGSLEASGWLPRFVDEPVWYSLKILFVYVVSFVVAAGWGWLVESVVNGWRKA